MSNDWSDIHGEHERGYVNILDYCKPNKQIDCNNCGSSFEFDELVPEFDENTDEMCLLCPLCGETLIEGE